MKTTDLLFGAVSLNDDGTHKFFCDIDSDDIDVDAVYDFLDKYNYLIIINSGRGLHLANNSCHITIDEYIYWLERFKADEKYIEWVKKVKYGVLRISRRSSHWKVPKIEFILSRRELSEKEKEDIMMYYFLLKIETCFKSVKKVFL